jgi:hypothetical protein
MNRAAKNEADQFNWLLDPLKWTPTSLTDDLTKESIGRPV